MINTAMHWKKGPSKLATAYDLDGPIHVHVGRWGHRDEHAEDWYVVVNGEGPTFLPAAITDGQALQEAERLLRFYLFKMAEDLWPRREGRPTMPIRSDEK